MLLGMSAWRSWCHPAPSRTTRAWISSARVSAKASKNSLVARVETSGRTSVKSSPVAGLTALKMYVHWYRRSQIPGGRWPRSHQR
ncbi:MAG: hypothetical protein RLO06_10835 [Parvibaculum sp.]